MGFKVAGHLRHKGATPNPPIAIVRKHSKHHALDRGALKRAGRNHEARSGGNQNLCQKRLFLGSNHRTSPHHSLAHVVRSVHQWRFRDRPDEIVGSLYLLLFSIGICCGDSVTTRRRRWLIWWIYVFLCSHYRAAAPHQVPDSPISAAHDPFGSDISVGFILFCLLRFRYKEKTFRSFDEKLHTTLKRKMYSKLICCLTFSL